MKHKASLFLVLILMGAGWGATQPLAKIAVSEDYRNFGIITWQMAIGALVLGSYLAFRGNGFVLGRKQAIFAIYIAMVGTILPNAASYQAAVHLPAGILSIAIAAVPMIAFPLALFLGLDRFGIWRFVGLLSGLAGVALLAAPDSLPDPSLAIWVLVALIGPMLYAVEGNSVAKLGTFGLGAVEVLFWASLIGVFIALPLSLANGTFIGPISIARWTGPEWAILLGSVIHAVVYASYVWLVGRAGPVFAGQVSYLVTGFGVLWAMLFLGETYPPTVWLALLLMMFGLFLVQPRESDPVASQTHSG